MAVATRRGHLTVAGLVLALAGAGTGAYLVHADRAAPPSVALAATTTIDPRLILHPRLLPVSGTLADGTAMHGAIYPAVPGANTLRLTLPSGTTTAPGALSYSVTMTGMRMRPVTGTLRRQGGLYTGAIDLPMFGPYRGTLAASAAAHGARGSLILSIPLPLLTAP